jgi:hypothetical protein
LENERGEPLETGSPHQLCYSVRWIALGARTVQLLKQWLFEPARMAREPVAVWVLLPVKFELQ